MSSTLNAEIILKTLPDTLRGYVVAADLNTRGQAVKRYRNYAAGDHDARLTKAMLRQLNLPLNTKSAFTTNYCETVIQAMADRLILEVIEGDSKDSTTWIQELLDENEVDQLGMDLHEATILDGDSYLMVSYEDGQVRFTLEPAYDGNEGVVVVYSRAGGRRKLEAALKLWVENTITRVNVYYADRLVKWASGKDGLQIIEESSWVTRQGDPIGIPIVHFVNRRPSNDNLGISELKGVVPQQDGLNRTVHSMVMASEYDAYQLRFVIGAPAPETIAPGAFLEWGAGGLAPDKKIETGSFPQGSITPFIAQAQWFVAQIGKTSRTPDPEMMGGDSSSGEALKQREIGLVGKCRRFHKTATTSWKNVIRLAWTIQGTFGAEPPALKKIYPRWASPEIRNDSELVANAKAIRDDISREEYLRIVAPVFGWDEEKVIKISKAKAAEDEMRVALMGQMLPNFEKANTNLVGEQNQNGRQNGNGGLGSTGG